MVLGGKAPIKRSEGRWLKDEEEQVKTTEKDAFRLDQPCQTPSNSLADEATSKIW